MQIGERCDRAHRRDLRRGRCTSDRATGCGDRDRVGRRRRRARVIERGWVGDWGERRQGDAGRGIGRPVGERRLVDDPVGEAELVLEGGVVFVDGCHSCQSCQTTDATDPPWSYCTGRYRGCRSPRPPRRWARAAVVEPRSAGWVEATTAPGHGCPQAPSANRAVELRRPVFVRRAMTSGTCRRRASSGACCELVSRMLLGGSAECPAPAGASACGGRHRRPRRRHGSHSVKIRWPASSTVRRRSDAEQVAAAGLAGTVESPDGSDLLARWSSALAIMVGGHARMGSRYARPVPTRMTLDADIS